MMQNHPELDQELDRLQFTKAYMDQLIASQKSSQVSLKKQQEDTLAKLNFKDSSLRYQEMLSHANFMKMSKDQLESLKHLRKKPYFARIDFQRKEKTDREIFYIGKMSLFDRETQLPIILDWRSPLANVYYEGRLGDVRYTAHGELFEGNVSLKRQYQIEDGELRQFRDIDMTTKDELLQDSLAQNAESRLTEIVATIQEEQNRVIRADLRKPIIVQGAAGSGKTTIALHRISYFLYTMRDIFKPEDMLILAPNRHFIQYISEVLPELGVQRAKQSTFQDYVKSVTAIDWQVISQHDVLLNTIEGSGPHSILWMAEYKGSPAFKEVLNNYLQLVKKKYKVNKDLYLGGFKIKSAKAINRLFYEEYNYFPYEVRVAKIKAVLQSEVRRKKKQILTKMAEKYDEELDKALFGFKDPEKRRKRVSFLITRKEERLDEVKKESRMAVRAYMNQYPKHSLADLYKTLFQEDVYQFLVEKDTEELKQMRLKMREMLKKKILYAEDLAPLLYLKSFLSGVDEDHQAKKIVIDEAQDYSFMEFCSLRKALHTDLFTIVGDLAQGIYRYRGIKQWEDLINGLFKKGNYLTLQKTYRTTVEIMNLANQLLNLMPEALPVAEPVVRYGAKPAFISSENWIKNVSTQMDELTQEGMKTFAIVTKTEKEAEVLLEMLPDSLGFTGLNERASIGNRVILPVYLAKGLEFDVVCLYVNESPYKTHELDSKLLYVAMTRPLHKLFLIGNKPEDFLLHLVDSQLFLHK